MYLHVELHGQHAGELSRVLGKNPDRLFEWEVMGSMVRVVFPLVERDRVRAVVLFWPDARSVMRRPGRTMHIEDFVNPRPFSVNSVFCTALETAFESAIYPRRLDSVIAQREHSLELVISPIHTHLSDERILGLCEPLGYAVALAELGDPSLFPECPGPRILELTLTNTLTTTMALHQVLILIWVLDSDRYDYLGQADVDRLLAFGEGWLDDHPERTFIITRYLKYRRLVDLYLQTTMRQQAEDGSTEPIADDGYVAIGEPIPVRQDVDRDRFSALVDKIAAWPVIPRRILHVGCRDGKLLAELVQRRVFEDVVGADSSTTLLSKARKRLERASQYRQALRGQITRFELMVSALGYNDPRLHGFDTVILCDVLERLEESQLPFVLAPVLKHWRPRHLVLTLPNKDWYDSMGEREIRHLGNRRAWRRDDFGHLCQRLIHGQPYSFDLTGVGQELPDRGMPVQVAIFTFEGKSPQ